MTWTYGGDPGSSDRDAVRLQIGDTDTTDQQLTDEEIAYFLTQNGDSVYSASLAAVGAIIAKYARLVDKAVGDLKISYSQRLASYQALQDQLKSELATRGSPVAGGLSKARKEAVEEDSDRVAPAIVRDQFSYPGTESSSDNDLNLDDD